MNSTTHSNVSDQRAMYRQMLISLIAGVSVALLVGFAQHVKADNTPDPRGLVIVMHLDIDVSSIDDEELRRLFTGKSRRLPNGARAALARYSPESSFFNEKLLGLSDAKVSSLWARMKFSGRTPPPRTFRDSQKLVSYVAATPNALAYMPASAAREGVRVITNLPR